MEPVAATTAETPPAIVEAPVVETKVEEPKVEEPKVETKTEEVPSEVKYEFKAPEGVTLDEKQIADFTALAQEAKVDPAVAQKFLDAHFTALNAQAKSFVEQQGEAWKKTTDGWKAEVAADPILGANKVEVQSTIARALDEFGSKEAREAFDLTGAGENPAVIRMIYKMAQALSEGTPTPMGKPAGKAPQTFGERLYGPNKGN